MKTEFEMRLGEKTFDEISRLMKAHGLSGGYGYQESIISREREGLVLRCHFKDDRMALRDILKAIDKLAVEESIDIRKVEITTDR